MLSLKLIMRVRPRKKELKTEKSELKSKLAAVTVSGLGHRKLKTNKKEPSFVHSGLLQIDLDRKDHPRLNSSKMLELLKSDPHVVACFLLLLEKLKGICAISPNEDDHLGCFLAAEKHFKEMGLTIDALPKIRRVSVTCHMTQTHILRLEKLNQPQPLQCLLSMLTQIPNHPVTQIPNHSITLKTMI